MFRTQILFSPSAWENLPEDLNRSVCCGMVFGPGGVHAPSTLEEEEKDRALVLFVVLRVLSCTVVGEESHKYERLCSSPALNKKQAQRCHAGKAVASNVQVVCNGRYNNVSIPGRGGNLLSFESLLLVLCANCLFQLIIGA